MKYEKKWKNVYYTSCHLYKVLEKKSKIMWNFDIKMALLKNTVSIRNYFYLYISSFVIGIRNRRVSSPTIIDGVCLIILTQKKFLKFLWQPLETLITHFLLCVISMIKWQRMHTFLFASELRNYIPKIVFETSWIPIYYHTIFIHFHFVINLILLYHNYAVNDNNLIRSKSIRWKFDLSYRDCILNYLYDK